MKKNNKGMKKNNKEMKKKVYSVFLFFRLPPTTNAGGTQTISIY